uniref:Inosine/uridine-preferring nucleoside hydrolase domain-containing protein n=1 Tax=Zea mays TaxID=4577 RepID=A0A804NJP1_MAIZE
MVLLLVVVFGSQSTDRTEPLFDGADDTMAIFLALRSPKLEVLGLTTTFGNVHTALATRNALHLVPPPTFLPLSPPPCSGIPSNDQESHQAEDRKLCPRFRRPEDRKLRPRFRRPLWIEVRQVGAPPRIVGSTETTSSPTSSYVRVKIICLLPTYLSKVQLLIK